MAKISKRAVPINSTIGGAIEQGLSIIEELKDEIEEVVSNMEQSEGLSQTSRYATLDETKSTLEDNYDAFDVHDLLADVPCTYTEDQRRRESSTRQGRMDNALAALNAARDAAQTWMDDNPLEDAIGTREELDEREEALSNAEEVINTLDERIGNLESCEFPGMYG